MKKNLFIFLGILFFVTVQKIVASTPQDFLWKNRLIVVEESKDIERQMKVFKDSIKGFNERKLIVLHYPKVLLARKKDFALLGLDGTIKAQSNKPFTEKFLFKLIDSMPMRQSEINSQN